MSTKADHRSQSLNVIHFRPKRMAFALPKEPTREELAFDWTLSEADRIRILRHRGDNNRRRYAVQLCMLRKYGRFLDSYGSVPAKVIGYLSRHLEITPTMDLSAPARQATESRYRQDICRYLGYCQFSDQSKQKLQRSILTAVSEFFYLKNPIEKAEIYLRTRKTVIPAPGHLERIVNAAYARPIDFQKH